MLEGFLNEILEDVIQTLEELLNKLSTLDLIDEYERT